MDCVFCRILSGEMPSKIVSERGDAVAFMDAFPLAAGHVLVVPRKHRPLLQDMTESEVADVFVLAARLAARTDSLAGSTLLALHNGSGAGQLVPHAHVHLVPRYGGDGAGAIHDLFERPANVSGQETDRAFESLRD